MLYFIFTLKSTFPSNLIYECRGSVSVTSGRTGTWLTQALMNEVRSTSHGRKQFGHQLRPLSFDALWCTI